MCFIYKCGAKINKKIKCAKFYPNNSFDRGSKFTSKSKFGALKHKFRRFCLEHSRKLCIFAPKYNINVLTVKLQSNINRWKK